MTLYKYLTGDRIDVLQNRKIRFTQPNAFNDPFEFRPYLEQIARPDHQREMMESEFHKVVNEQLHTLAPTLARLPAHQRNAILCLAKQRAIHELNIVTTLLVPQIDSQIDEHFNAHVGVLCLSETRESLLMWGHYADSHKGF